MSKLEIYGTFGPTCHSKEMLMAMLEAGMNGIRLNLSHSSLMDHEDWIENLHQACQETHKECHLVIDLQGRERRLGTFDSFEVKPKDLLEAPVQLPIPYDVLSLLKVDDGVWIGDQDLELRLQSIYEGSWIFEVQEAGLLEGHKSIHLHHQDSNLTIFSEKDLKNFHYGKQAGVDGVLVPFVQQAQDLQVLRQTLHQFLPHCRLMAKIENMVGVQNIEEIIQEADMIVIARGDLASACGLTWLPAIQNYLENICRAQGIPYMVVTQMLESMRQLPVPTRPEVCDVFQAVQDGAAAIMLTGETASSKYPIEAMSWFCTIANHALELKKDPYLIKDLIKKF